MDIKIEGSENHEKTELMEDDKKVYLQQIETLKERYLSNLELMGHDNQAVTAFILFRSMEGVERTIYAYKEWRITKIFFYIFKCFQSEK